MKTFGFMTEQQNIDGHNIPANAVYGRLNLSYMDKHFTGKTRPIFDKNGYPVFNADGTPATRKVFKLIPKKVEVTYSVEDLFPVTMSDGIFFRAWYKIGRCGKWHEDVLCLNQITRELNKFIAGKLQGYCDDNNKTLFDLCTRVESVKTDSNRKKHKMARAAAPRRKVQTADDMPFRGHMCYALNPSIMTDDGRPKASMNKSVIATHKGAFNGMHGEEPARYDKPFVKADYKMVGQEPTFTKFVETPSGILRFYNEREYNEYMSAQK